MIDDLVDRGRRGFFHFGAAALLASSMPGLAIAQPAAGKLKIGVIGAGHIGSTIGGLWVKAGHSVLFSSRHPEELKSLTDSLGPLAKAGTVSDALEFGTVVLVAVPYKAIPELAKDYGPKFAGKIVIDPANAVARRHGVLPQRCSCGARVQFDGLQQLRQGGASRGRCDGDTDRRG
jgi:hypothetical protein